MTVISDAKKLLKDAKKWASDERIIDKKLKELEHHKRQMYLSETHEKAMHHTRRYHLTYKVLAKLIADKRRIEYDIHKIHHEIERELTRRRKTI